MKTSIKYATAIAALAAAAAITADSSDARGRRAAVVGLAAAPAGVATMGIVEPGYYYGPGYRYGWPGHGLGLGYGAWPGAGYAYAPGYYGYRPGPLGLGAYAYEPGYAYDPVFPLANLAVTAVTLPFAIVAAPFTGEPVIRSRLVAAPLAAAPVVRPRAAAAVRAVGPRPAVTPLAAAPIAVSRVYAYGPGYRSPEGLCWRVTDHERGFGYFGACEAPRTTPPARTAR